MAVRICSNRLAALIEEKGAELVSLTDTNSGTEILWDGDPRFWARRSPILFPVVGKLRDDSYSLDGRTYSMGQHGFARDTVFKMVSSSGDGVTFHIEGSRESLEKYPFRFALDITYELNGRSLSVTTGVGNEGETRMPFSIGFHPGFKCPFEEGEKLGDYALFFEKSEECERLVLEKGLISDKEAISLTSGVIRLSEELFERDALIFRGLRSEKVTLGRIDKRGRKIDVAFHGMPYLGVWKKKDAPFVCIEPWQGLADHRDRIGNDIFDKEGILVLDPGDSFNVEMTITCLE